MELPREESLRWIVSRYAGLHARHGEGIGTPELVQPTGDYFPDEFSMTGEGVARLLARVLYYAPVRAGLDVGLRFTDAADDAESCGTGGCGSGGCGAGAGAATESFERVIEADDSYVLELPAEVVRSPIVLTSTLARAAGRIVLAEAGEDIGAAELGGMSELAAVACGFGVIVASAAHVYGKSCGGAHIASYTHLSLEELAVALALFAAHHGVRTTEVKAHLETTQREALAEATAWVDSNPAIVTQLRTRPEVLEAGMFRCEETKGFFGRLLARRTAAEEERAFAITPARQRESV